MPKNYWKEKLEQQGWRGPPRAAQVAAVLRTQDVREFAVRDGDQILVVFYGRLEPKAVGAFVNLMPQKATLVSDTGLLLSWRNGA